MAPRRNQPLCVAAVALLLLMCASAQNSTQEPDSSLPNATVVEQSSSPPTSAGTPAPPPTATGTAQPAAPKTSTEKFRDWWSTERIVIVVVCVTVGIAALCFLVVVIISKSRRVIGVTYLNSKGKWVHEDPPPPPGACVSAPQASEEKQPLANAAASTSIGAAAASTATATATSAAAGPAPSQATPAVSRPQTPAPPPIATVGAPVNPYTRPDSNLQEDLRREISKADVGAIARDVYRMRISVAKPDGSPNAAMAYDATDFKSRNAAVYHTLSQIATLVGEQETVGAHLARVWSSTVNPPDAADISPFLMTILGDPIIVGKAADGGVAPSRTLAVLRTLHQGVLGTATNAVKAALWTPWNDPVVFTINEGETGAVTRISALPGTTHVFIKHYVTATSFVAATFAESATAAAERQRTPVFAVAWESSLEIDTAKTDPEALISADVFPTTIRLKAMPAADPSDPSRQTTWKARADELKAAAEKAYGPSRVKITTE